MPFSRYKFCDGFVVEGFFIKRVNLLLQVYPSISQDNVIRRLSEYGEIFLLKCPFGFIILFKQTTLCFSFKFWKKFFLRRFLSSVKDVVPEFCHFRVLSCKEVDEILGRYYIPVEAAFLYSKNYSSQADLIYFPKSRKSFLYAAFKADARGSNVLSLGKVNVKCFEAHGFTDYRLFYDEFYVFLKSLYVYKCLFERYSTSCPVKASIIEEGSHYRIKILSSPQMSFEKEQFNLQLSIYSLSLNMLQKG